MLDRLEASFAGQRQFLDDAAHELRTPLTVIRGNIELADAHDPLDIEATNEIVLDELDRMQRLVDDLLLLARAERPDFIQPYAVPLSEVATEARQRAEHLGPRDWRLVIDSDVWVDADRQRLLQSLLQLAANAVRHTSENDVITIGASRTPAGPSLWVEDSGEGIAPEDQQRIFERFSRLPGATRDSGTGLGLTIVQAIADGHGGTVELESELGVGSRFTIVLPPSRVTEAPGPTTRRRTSTRAADPTRPSESDLGHIPRVPSWALPRRIPRHHWVWTQPPAPHESALMFDSSTPHPRGVDLPQQVTP